MRRLAQDAPQACSPAAQVHTPSAQDPAPQLVSQVPQCAVLVARSKQAPSQRVRPAGQAIPMARQAPASHTSPTLQRFPQLPQCSSLLRVSAQTPSQSVSSGRHECSDESSSSPLFLEQPTRAVRSRNPLRHASSSRVHRPRFVVRIRGYYHDVALPSYPRHDNRGHGGHKSRQSRLLHRSCKGRARDNVVRSLRGPPTSGSGELNHWRKSRLLP